MMKTRRIASVHIHVERAIDRIKTCRIFKQALPIKSKSTIGTMIFVCAGLCNLKNELIKRRSSSLCSEEAPLVFPDCGTLASYPYTTQHRLVHGDCSACLPSATHCSRSPRDSKEVPLWSQWFCRVFTLYCSCLQNARFVVMRYCCHPEKTANIARMLALALQPYSEIINRGFKKLVNSLEPTYKIPASTAFSRIAILNSHSNTQSCERTHMHRFQRHCALDVIAFVYLYAHLLVFRTAACTK